MNKQPKSWNDMMDVNRGEMLALIWGALLLGVGLGIGGGVGVVLFLGGVVMTGLGVAGVHLRHG